MDIEKKHQVKIEVLDQIITFFIRIINNKC